MSQEQAKRKPGGTGTGQPYRVRLPGFVSDEEVGLGDAIKRATSTVGITPCGGCGRRAAALNRWMVFSGRHPNQRALGGRENDGARAENRRTTEGSHRAS